MIGSVVGGDEEHIHLPLGVARLEDLEVQIDFVHIEGDVLLRLPANLFVELFPRHLGQRDLLHDHRVATHGRGDVLALDLRRLDRLANCVGDRTRVQERPLYDRFVWELSHTEVRELEVSVLATARELDGLDRRRTDVETDERIGTEAR